MLNGVYYILLNFFPLLSFFLRNFGKVHTGLWFTLVYRLSTWAFLIICLFKAVPYL